MKVRELFVPRQGQEIGTNANGISDVTLYLKLNPLGLSRKSIGKRPQSKSRKVFALELSNRQFEHAVEDTEMSGFALMRHSKDGGNLP